MYTYIFGFVWNFANQITLVVSDLKNFKLLRNIHQLTTGTIWKLRWFKYTRRSFKLDFLENEASNEKTLLLLFDLFLRAESLPVCCTTITLCNFRRGSRRLPGSRFYFQSFPGSREATVISSGLRSSTSYRFPGGGLFEFTHAPTVYSHERRPRLSLFLQFSSSREYNL